MLLNRLKTKFHSNHTTPEKDKTNENETQLEFDEETRVEYVSPVPIKPEHNSQLPDMVQAPQPGYSYGGDIDELVPPVDRSFCTPVPSSISTPVNSQPTYLGLQGNANLAGYNHISRTNSRAGSFLPPYLNRAMQNSTCSLASSVSDFPRDSNKQRSFESDINGTELFTDDFLNLLMEIYQSVCMDPTVTPFNTASPPSGILDRVAKIAAEQSKVRHIEIGLDRSSNLLTMIRHRLLELTKDCCYSASCNDSLTSFPSPPPQFSELMGTDSSLQNPDGILNPCLLDPFPKMLHSLSSSDSFNMLSNTTGIPLSISRSSSSIKNGNPSLQYVLPPQPSGSRGRSTSNTVFSVPSFS